MLRAVLEGRVQAPRPLRLDRLTEPLEVVGESAQFGGDQGKPRAARSSARSSSREISHSSRISRSTSATYARIFSSPSSGDSRSGRFPFLTPRQSHSFVARRAPVRRVGTIRW
ncbi:hypothetical protein ASD08_03540 [Streptomyces sp. Root369]|nr:hypothetical protein ASD08_03540 [Streptomyces sp. Root369]